MEDEKAGKAGKVLRPGVKPPKFGGTTPPVGGALTPDQQTVARGILANYDLKNLDSIQARKIADLFNTMGLGEGGLRWALQNVGVDPIPFFNLVRMAQSGANQYVMTDAVKNGINVRQKATSESKLLYMLAKVDATHPVITINKFSDDKLWGFMETGDKDKNGWIYMEYVKRF